MAELSKWLTSLEEWDDMPADLIKVYFSTLRDNEWKLIISQSTKIHKVLRGIMNVDFAIPLEETYTFKARSEPLHAKWVETIRNADKPAKAEEPSKADESAKEDEEVKENGVNGEAEAEAEETKTEKEEVTEAEKAGLPAEAADAPEAGVEVVERKGETLVLTEVTMKDAPAAAAASTDKEEGETATAATDSKAAEAETEEEVEA